MDYPSEQTLTDDFVALLREFAARHTLDAFGLVSITASSLCLMSIAWRPTGQVPAESRDMLVALIEHYLHRYDGLLPDGGGKLH